MYLKSERLEVAQDMVAMRLDITCKGTNKKEAFINIYGYDVTGKLRIQALYRGEDISCQIGGEGASAGCFKGDIPKGIWNIVTIGEVEDIDLVYAVHPIPLGDGASRGNQLPVENQKGEKWYRGDFHTHTCLSDGSLTLEEIPEVMDKNHLDFIFLTDHNICPSHLEGYRGIFKGIEVTLPSGHINIHGVLDYILEDRNRVEAFYSQMMEGLASPEDMIREIQGGNVSVNHAFMEPWHYTYDALLLEHINTIEVICDPTWHTAREANDKAIRFLHFLNAQGHRITGIGGSDSHLPYGDKYEWAKTPSWYGDPTTYVWSKECTPESILEATRKGRVYVCRKGTLEIAIQGGKYLPGDTVTEAEITYEITSKMIDEATYIDLMMNGVRKERVAISKEKHCLNIKFKEQYECISIEIRDVEEHILALINPIYYGERAPRFQTWGEAITVFDEQEGAGL